MPTLYNCNYSQLTAGSFSDKDLGAHVLVGRDWATHINKGNFGVGIHMQCLALMIEVHKVRQLLCLRLLVFLYASGPPLYSCHTCQDHNQLVYGVVPVDASWHRTHSTQSYRAESHGWLHTTQNVCVVSSTQAYPGTQSMSNLIKTSSFRQLHYAKHKSQGKITIDARQGL